MSVVYDGKMLTSRRKKTWEFFVLALVVAVAARFWLWKVLLSCPVQTRQERATRPAHFVV